MIRHETGCRLTVVACSIIVLILMHSVWNSDDQNRKDPNSNDHGLGSMLGGVPPKNKDRKSVDSDSLELARQKVSEGENWRKIYTRDLSKSVSPIMKEEKIANTHVHATP